MTSLAADRAPGAAAPSLRRNLGFALSGRVLFALTQFALISVVAHLGRPEQVGAMTLASAIVTPLFFLTSMGMRDVHAVDDLDRYSRADYVATRLAGGAVAVLLTLAAVATLARDAGWMVQSAVIALAAVKFVGAQSALNHGIFQRAERLDFVALSLLARGLAGLAVFALAFWAWRDLAAALAAEALAWYLAYLVVDRDMLRRLRALTALAEVLAARPRRIARLVWWILPVGIALWLTRAAVSAPPLVLARHADLATVGVFGAMLYLHSAVSMLAGTLGSAAAARLRRHYRDGDRRGYLRVAGRLSALAAGCGAVLVGLAWLLGEPALGLLFGEAYRRGDLLAVVALASAIGVAGAPLATAVTAAQAFRRRLAMAAGTCGAGVLAALLLIPAFGATGAAWALVALSTVQLALTVLNFRAVLGALPPAATVGAAP